MARAKAGGEAEVEARGATVGAVAAGDWEGDWEAVGEATESRVAAKAMAIDKDRTKPGMNRPGTPSRTGLCPPNFYILSRSTGLHRVVVVVVVMEVKGGATEMGAVGEVLGAAPVAKAQRVVATDGVICKARR